MRRGDHGDLGDWRLGFRRLNAREKGGKLVVKRRGARRRCGFVNYLKIAIPGDEIEDVADRVFVFHCRQLDSPGEIGPFWIKFAEERQVGNIARCFEFAEFGEFAQDQRRLIGLGVETGLGLEIDREDVFARRRWLIAEIEIDEYRLKLDVRTDRLQLRARRRD